MWGEKPGSSMRPPTSMPFSKTPGLTPSLSPPGTIVTPPWFAVLSKRGNMCSSKSLLQFGRKRLIRLSVSSRTWKTSHFSWSDSTGGFPPQIARIKVLLTSTKEPKAFVYTVNAGAVPSNHWILDPERGGGRIVGEACHFIDVLRFLAGTPMVDLSHTAINNESVSINVSYADGSIGNIHYLANGNRTFPKERLEVFCEGRVLQLDNFRKLRAFGWPRFHPHESVASG